MAVTFLPAVKCNLQIKQSSILQTSSCYVHPSVTEIRKTVRNSHIWDIIIIIITVHSKVECYLFKNIKFIECKVNNLQLKVQVDW
jgi:hypothetical protein